jgi:hypothetical protein
MASLDPWSKEETVGYMQGEYPNLWLVGRNTAYSCPGKFTSRPRHRINRRSTLPADSSCKCSILQFAMVGRVFGGARAVVQLEGAT